MADICCGPGYASPQAAMKAEPEKLLYAIALYTGTGIENTETQGYHKTITRFYVWLLNKFLQQTERSQPIDLLADRLISLYGDKSFPLNYYSRDKLMSKTARLQWVEPDLKPLVLR